MRCSTSDADSESCGKRLIHHAKPIHADQAKMLAAIDACVPLLRNGTAKATPSPRAVRSIFQVCCKPFHKRHPAARGREGVCGDFSNPGGRVYQAKMSTTHAVKAGPYDADEAKANGALSELKTMSSNVEMNCTEIRKMKEKKDKWMRARTSRRNRLNWK